jgi:FkbH-like protein
LNAPQPNSTTHPRLELLSRSRLASEFEPRAVESKLMNDEQLRLEPASGLPAHCIAIAATFTAEPVEEALTFWMEEIVQPGSIEFAPYNQVFQQLLDPNSLLGRNHQGINVVLLRLEDWRRFHEGVNSRRDLESILAQNAADLINAVLSIMVRSSTPLMVTLCPNSPVVLADPEMRKVYAEIEEQIAAALDQIPNLCLIRPDDFRNYPVDDAYDLQRDQLGHIPYTRLLYVVLGTILARKIHALWSPPFKVIALDCDNTIWKGVVGEEGIEGIAIPPVWRQLQQFMVELSRNGFLLCLCSKNDESDVLEVFDKRPDMILKRDHLVSWRINWRPKSENIRSLAQELNLGLDSFIFLDDNPLECAEVRSGCPAVLTLQLPLEEDIADFLDNVWAFDRLKVTSEDQQRTAMYKQEIERTRFQTQTLTIEEFLEGLNLQVKLSELSRAQLSRVAQLTQRTNQFNFTTMRRTEAQIQHLSESGLECRVVEVSDRFGDYGLVGVMIFSARREALEVDTFLLSCRVLSRGVEHRMLNELGKIALEYELPMVVATLVPTKKNQPAADFLENVVAPFRQEIAGSNRYSIPAAFAAGVVFSQASVQSETTRVSPIETRTSGAPGGLSRRLERIATELFSPEQVLETLRARSRRRRSRSEFDRPFVAPRTEIEEVLTQLWASLLRFEPVGIQDDFFELGGTSLLAVDLFAQIHRQLGQRLPLAALIEGPTIEQLACFVARGECRDSLVRIREGGDKPPLFLVHDGDGETMLYRNLAVLLKNDRAIYGLPPGSRQNIPLAQTRISEMAAHHIDKIRSVQAQGPYLLGGMCAGGVIAYEIARQLQSQGETVAMVALLDAADVTAPLKTWHFASQRMHSFSTAFHREESVQFYRSVLEVTTKALCKAKNLTIYLVGQRLKNLRDEIRMRLFRFYLDRGLQLPRALQQIAVRTVYLFAEKNYQPESPFHGELVLFRATCGEGPDEPYVERYSDPLLGWNRRTSHGVRVCDIPGGHSSMLQEPNVRVLATRMQAYLDRALASESTEPADRL